MNTVPLRLLLVTPAICRSGGGVAEAARLLAHGLQRTGNVSLEVVTLMSPYLNEDRTGWPDVPIHAFRAYGPRNYGFSPGMLLHMMRAQADVAHVHGIWMMHCFATMLWAKLHRRPYVVSVHGMMEPWIRARSRRLKRLVSTLYQDRFLRNAFSLPVLTDREAADVKALFPNSRAPVIPNFIIPVRNHIAKPKWWKTQLQDRTIYLFLGRIHEKKGWRELATAWDKVCSTFPDFGGRSELIFAGWPDNCPDFVPTISALAAKNGNIRHVGPIYGCEKEATFAASNIFILPSKSEGLPMAILEAWAAGLPVLMTAACNLPRGFAVGAAEEIGETAEEIVQALLRCDDWSPVRIAAMSKAGPALIEAEFSEAAIIAETLGIYRDASVRFSWSGGNE